MAIDKVLKLTYLDKDRVIPKHRPLKKEEPNPVPDNVEPEKDIELPDNTDDVQKKNEEPVTESEAVTPPVEKEEDEQKEPEQEIVPPAPEPAAEPVSVTVSEETPPEPTEDAVNEKEPEEEKPEIAETPVAPAAETTPDENDKNPTTGDDNNDEKPTIANADADIKENEEGIPAVKETAPAQVPADDDVLTPEQKGHIAIYGLGRALLQKHLFPELRIEDITASAKRVDVTAYKVDNIEYEGTLIKTEILNRICVCMAGTAAEKIFFGEYGNRGITDLKEATMLATKMITRYGMSEKGFACFDALNDAGRDEVNRILSSQFDAASKVIQGNRPELEQAMKYLLEKHAITDEEFSIKLRAGISWF